MGLIHLIARRAGQFVKVDDRRGALLAPNSAMAYYASWNVGGVSFVLPFVREAVYVARGEEVLSRGLLGGIFNRRLGFVRGNTIKAMLFVLPHMAFLLVSTALWPLMLVWFALDWLRYRSDSIAPGWFAHSVINAASFIFFHP